MDNCYRFHDLFDQLGLPSSEAEIAAFLKKHRPLPGNVLLADAPFWDEGQSQFLREKKATDDPQWSQLIDQLSEALREDPPMADGATGVRVLGISGSLRAGSFNTALLHAAKAALGDTAALDIATLHGIPLYDGDLEAKDGLPAAVVALRERIRATDGVLLVTPEYNSGVPGVFKNAMDWVSRNSAQHPNVLNHKPVAVIGASTGGFGTISAQNHWLPVLRALGMLHWSGARLLVSKADAVLKDGKVTDAAVAQQLADYMTGYARFVSLQTVRQ